MKAAASAPTERPLTLNDAWFYSSCNLMFPGSGSILARRWVGYPQLLLTLAGFALTLWFGIRLLLWTTQHWGEMWSNHNDDPVELLVTLWQLTRWILLGFALFGLACLWAATTSLSLVRAARRQMTPPLFSPEQNIPPRINS